MLKEHGELEMSFAIERIEFDYAGKESCGLPGFIFCSEKDGQTTSRKMITWIDAGGFL